ncbi:MAG: lamin tail domain-containing protein [Patescibacteria group bacterium]
MTIKYCLDIFYTNTFRSSTPKVTKLFFIVLKISLIALALLLIPFFVLAQSGSVVINEIAWMGTTANSADEWLELFNTTNQNVDLTDWRLFEISGSTSTPIITLSGSVSPNGYYLIERTDDNSVANIPAHVFGPFSGSGLSNSGENLVLKNSVGEVIDSVNATGGWLFGDSITKASMERKSDGTWQTNDGITKNGNDAAGNPIVGTPKAMNSGSSTSSTTTPSSSTSQSITGGGSGSSGSAVSSLPVLKAEAGADIVIETNQPIAFSGLASQGAKIYKWYLGDGNIKDGAEITHTYQFPGTYLVTLEVSNGVDTNIDQSRVFVFGGKVLISEFFIGTASTTASNAAGGWVELYNPNNFSVDLSGWILESGETKFSAPNFVLIPAKGYLVLSQSVTGLDLSRSNKLQLKYPNGFIVDVVSFEKNKPEASANRSVDGFFWSKELTPGQPNVIVSSSPNLGLNSSILPRLVLSKPQENPRILAAASYNIVADSPAEASIGDNFSGNNPAISAQLPFWQKIYKSIFFWIFSTALLGAVISWGYITLFRKK